MADQINKRKAEHITLCLTDQVTGEGITSGMESVRLIHNALPEIDFNKIALNTTFFDHEMKTPFLVSSMTGGSEEATKINQNLASAAEERGWVFALGSTRALVENDDYQESFRVRDFAPTIPIIANLGSVQLNYGFTIEKCQKIIELTEANALVLHLNTIQEVIQTNGDTNFENLLPKIAKLTETIGVPVGVKEVGWGIDGESARQLRDAGIQFIDVAGAGGTSWSQVEKLRSNDPVRKEAAEAFVDWGIGTVESLITVKEAVQDTTVFASGGMKTGVDAAKAIALGADLVGFARSLLKDATTSVEAVMQMMETRELELRMAMFGLGTPTLNDLQKTKRIELT